MGYPQPWYSVRGVEENLLTQEGHLECYLRDDDRVFLTYSTSGMGVTSRPTRPWACST